MSACVRGLTVVFFHRSICEQICVPQSFLSGATSLLETADQLQVVLLEELDEWKRRQQVSCIGAPEDTNLEPLEKWYDCMTRTYNLLNSYFDLQFIFSVLNGRSKKY